MLWPFTLHVLAAPWYFGTMDIRYIQSTVALGRTPCWDKALEWAIDQHHLAHLYCVQDAKGDYLFGEPTPQDIYQKKTWARYKLDAPRAVRIAWLKRHGCSVVVGRFTSDKEAYIDSSSCSVGETQAVPPHPPTGSAL